MNDSSGTVSLTRESGIARITLDNPTRHNAMTLAMWNRLSALAAELDADDTIRCVIVTGAGGRAFSAGADIGEFGEHRRDSANTAAYDRASTGAMQALAAIRKPTLAMISGYCIGGGMGLALACDLRIAAEGSQFGIPAARLGLAYDIVLLHRLTRIAGPSTAKQLLFSAARLDAHEARERGLVDRLVPADELEQETMALARTIAANAPLTIAAAKYAIDMPEAAGPEHWQEAERRLRACFDSEDYQEGKRAFAEKRAPRFKGK